MTSFAYQGQSIHGHKSGSIEAASAGAAALALKSQGITPFDIVEKMNATDSWWKKWLFGKQRYADAAKPTWRSSLGLSERIYASDVMLLARQLHVLLHAGVPILSGLSSLRDVSSSFALKEILTDVIAKLESGQDLSSCMNAHPRAFDEFFVSMVRVGEETGKLDDVFLTLYTRMEFDERISRQIKTATRYPVFVLSAIAAALVITNLLVIPTFAQVFAQMGAQLPLLTRVLLGFSKFTQEQLPYLIAGAFALTWYFKTWIKTPIGKLTWHTILLKMPLFGSIVLKASLARFCRGMSLALSSGVPVLQALSVVARSTDNESLRQSLMGMRETIEHGESVYAAAQQSGVFPPMVMQMIAVGDQSGRLDDMMTEVSITYTKDVQYELQTFSQRLEPILIAVMGVLVLVLALGIFLPIWDLGRVTLNKG